MTSKMHDAMAAAGVRVATHFSVGHCTNPDCDCGHLFIQFLDAEGKIFAVAPFGADAVDGVCDLLIESASIVLNRAAALKAGLPAPANVRDFPALVGDDDA